MSRVLTLDKAAFAAKGMADYIGEFTYALREGHVQLAGLPNASDAVLEEEARILRAWLSSYSPDFPAMPSPRYHFPTRAQWREFRDDWVPPVAKFRELAERQCLPQVDEGVLRRKTFIRHRSPAPERSR